MAGAVIVTGAARGIGLAIATRFVESGRTVVMGDIDGAAVERAASALGARAARVDVTDPDDVAAFVAGVPGRVDAVVNNAGVVHVGPLIDLDISDWRRVFAVNVEGCLNMTQAAARRMAAQDRDDRGERGRIVNIGSPAAEAPRPLLAAYGASKAAINHLSRSAAVAFGDEGISVVVVYPTNVEDGMWSSLPDAIGVATARSRHEVIAERLATAPTGRFETAAEVAAMVEYSVTAPGLNGKLLWTEAHVVDL